MEVTGDTRTKERNSVAVDAEDQQIHYEITTVQTWLGITSDPTVHKWIKRDYAEVRNIFCSC